jgi:cytochrome c-type biogenesis protein CcmH/NrfG
MKAFSTAAQLDPASAQPFFLMGGVLLQAGRDTEAVTQLRAALRLDPDNLQLLIFTVSVLAADENPGGRDGAAARALADQAGKLTNGRQPAVLDIQAMACAETGQFDQAAQIEEQAIKLAEAAGQKEDAAVMQNRLQLYRQRQPWRESFMTNAAAH